MYLGLHGVAVGGRRLDDTEVARTHERELKGTGYRGSGHGQGIYIDFELAQFLFDADAKLLLFVDDEQTQVVEFDVLTQNAVGTNEDIDLAGGYTLDNGTCLRSRTGTAEIFDAAGHIFQTLLEGLEMLVGQYGGGYQDCHLLVVAGSLEGGTDGHFGFAKAYVATYQTVHGAVAFHIGLHIGCSFALVGGIFVKERGFQLVLQEAVGAEAVAFLLTALRIEADEVAGNVFYLLLGAVFQLFPSASAQLVQPGCLAFLAFILGYLVQGVYGYKYNIVVLIDQFHDLLSGVAVWDTYKPCETAYTVVGVYYIVARAELVELLERQGHLATAGTVALEVVLVKTVEQLVVGEDAQVQGVVGKAFVQGTVYGSELYVVAPFFEDVVQAVGLFLAVAANEQGIALLHVLLEAVGHEVEVLVEDGLRRGIEQEGGIGGACRLGAELYTAKVQGADCKFTSIYEFAVQADGSVLFGLTGSNGLGREGFVVHLLDTFAQP